MNALLPKTLLLGALALAFAGPAPALAQSSTPRWSPRVESITVRASAPKNYLRALTATHLGSAIMVSASLPVPYADLNLGQAPDVDELTRRIDVAARLVCQMLDDKYPPTQFPLLEGYSGRECVVAAKRESMEQANIVIASKH
jgi:UrcA family protein